MIITSSPDEDGNQWLVWQGFHGDNSDIFLRHNNGAGWSEEVRVTEDPANDWEPRIAVNSSGKAYVVWDTYRNGNYDIYLRSFEDGILGPEVAVADTPLFEAHPTVAVDGQDRVWVAWDEAGPNWAKDYGPTIDSDWRGKDYAERFKASPGERIHEPRNLNMVVFEGSARRVPISEFPPQVAGQGNSYEYPQLMIDRHNNRVALLFQRQGRAEPRARGYWEHAVIFYEGTQWSSVLPMPWSWGRNSARADAAFAAG